MSVADLPHVNAAINTCVAILLIVGLSLIRRGRRDAHKKAMTAALVLSALFLASYLTYHYMHGSTKFRGEGFIRPVYFTILLTHTVLAVVNLPLIIMTVVRAWRGEFAKHRRIAKVTFWMWLYVAVTGPLVYLLLYQLYPSDGGVKAFAQAQEIHRGGDREAARDLYWQAAEDGHVGATCYATVLDATLGADTSTAGLRAALARHADDLHCMTLLGREHVYANELDEAKALLTRVVERAPEDAFAIASLGFAYFRGYEYQEAGAAFEKAMKLDGTVAMYAYNAGYAHYLRGAYKEAEPLLERAIELGLDPTTEARAKEDLGVIQGGIWVCPMHAEERGKKGDICKKCKMPLEPVSRGVRGDEVE